MWPKVWGEYSYPMTKLWPEGPVRRVLHFIQTCKRVLPKVFEDYTENGGEFYGPDKEDTESSENTDDDDDDDDDEEDQEEDQDKMILSQVDAVF